MPQTNLLRSNGPKIKQLRALKGWIQEDLADAARLHRRQIQKIEASMYVGAPSLLAVAGALDEDLPSLIMPAEEPKTRFITGADEEEISLLESSFKCLEQLFPDQAQRGDLWEILDWLTESRLAQQGENESRWRELYGVMHVGREVLGVGYISVQLDRGWSFASYFGVLNGWRQLGSAELFWRSIKQELVGLASNLKGIVFLVDPIDWNFLTEVAGRLAAGKSITKRAGEQALKDNLRALKRLNYFQSG
jgi:transcriptional regulator with XRE-family HTH domain